MKLLRAFIAVATAAGAIPMAAQASVVRDVNMTFASGATFSGQVTFADDLSSYSGVNGVLSGGSYGTDAITWVWDAGNRSSGANNFSNWLMDGVSQANYSHWIQFAYNYSDPAHLAFTSGVSVGGYDNFVNYNDAFVSGTISSPTAVPESSPLSMAMAGLAVIGFLARRKTPRA